MKKLISILSTAMLTFTLVGCSSDEPAYSYSDGAGNTYWIQGATLTYDPVTPLESSSGEYSGGEPATIELTQDEHAAIVSLFDVAIGDTSNHIENRVMMSGVIDVRKGKKTTSFILAPKSVKKTEIETMLEGLLVVPLITLDSPTEGQTISSPLTITGNARGPWYFEATFPVILTNWDGLIIAEGYATALDDWMTEEFVPFEATLTFEVPDYGDTGALILRKANASGLPENDDALEIGVMF